MPQPLIPASASARPNFAWGDADGRTLYMTAHTGLYRIRLGVSGTRPPLEARR